MADTTGAAAFFVPDKAVPRLVIPKDSATYDKESNTLRFTDDSDYSFAVVIHEASHLLHFARDHMAFHAPHLYLKYESKPIDPNKYASDMEVKRDIEYEAGYRSLMFKKHNQLIDNDLIKLVNIHNMALIEPENQDYIRDLMKDYVESVDDKTRDDMTTLVRNNILFKHYKNMKFSDCKNPVHLDLSNDEKDNMYRMLDAYSKQNTHRAYSKIRSSIVVEEYPSRQERSSRGGEDGKRSVEKSW